jgi:hypothetical protein
MKDLTQEVVAFAGLSLLIGGLIGIAVGEYQDRQAVQEKQLFRPAEQVNYDGLYLTGTITLGEPTPTNYLGCKCPQCMFHNAPRDSSAWQILNHPELVGK